MIVVSVLDFSTGGADKFLKNIETDKHIAKNVSVYICDHILC